MYFAKYLPVEGKVEEGDWGFCTHEEPNLPGYSIIHLIGKEWEFYKAQNNWYPAKKVKLFLCSGDIKVGDKVFKPRFENLDTFIVLDNEQKTFKEKWITLSEAIFGGYFKKVGLISPEATWVKEGDELERKNINPIYVCEKGDECDLYFGKQICPASHNLIDTIKIKGPCGHFH